MTESLLSRLQALTGPDREIDAEIALEVDPWLKDCSRDDRGGEPGWMTKDGRAYPPRYTASIDAALTLVPHGPTWVLGKWFSKSGEGPPVYWFDFHGREELQARHENPAIALCIAIMKAKEESTP